MPITAKFSKAFYDKLGHEIADEMVTWFNQADAVYRTQLRELNDLNYARFEARLEQFEAKLEQFEAKMDQRFAEHDAKWERRFGELDTKWERRIVQLDAKWERRFGELDAKWERRFGELSAKVDALAAVVAIQPKVIQGSLMKWTVLLWATTILAIVGIG